MSRAETRRPLDVYVIASHALYVRAMVRIEIGARNYLLYLLLPNERKVALLTPASR
jgi:hypothetical protein